MAMRLSVILGLLVAFPLITAAQQPEAKRKVAAQSKVVAVEVFQVIELPLSIRAARLLKTNKGYVLQGVVSNNTDEEMIGLRYSVVEADLPRPRLLTNRIEGFNLPGYSSREMTFQTAVPFNWKEGVRLVLMLEQVVGPRDIWEVVKAKDALDAYIAADYSIVPRVIHAANQTDAPLPGRRFIP